MIRAYPLNNINLSHRDMIKAAQKALNAPREEREAATKEFEDKFCSFIGARHALGLSSARFGLYLLLKTLAFEKGREVMLSAYNFYIIPEIIRMSGLKPVFVDVQERTCNINPLLIEERITENTRAIIVTHMFGRPCEMDAILKICAKYDLILIEDCAHACGAAYRNQKTGSFGDAAIFSFGFGKNIPCLGGGMVTVNNEELYRKIKEQIRMYRSLSSLSILKRAIVTGTYLLMLKRIIFNFLVFPVFYICDYVSFNPFSIIVEKIPSKVSDLPKRHKALLSRIQAEIGIIQLERIKQINEALIDNAAGLNNLLKSQENVVLPEINDKESLHIYSNYMIQVNERSLFIKKLLKKGIVTIEDENTLAYSNGNYESAVAKRVHERILGIPNYKSLRNGDINYIASQIMRVNGEINKNIK